MANIERLKELRNFINDLPDVAFNMGNWCRPKNQSIEDLYLPSETWIVLDHLIPMKERGYTCGTTACLAGWCSVLYSEEFQRKNRYDDVKYASGEWLGLEPYERSCLFVPSKNLEKIPKSQAVKVLDHFIETGYIDWDIE